MISGGVCPVVSFLYLVFQMKSIGYNPSDGTLFLSLHTLRPNLEDGDIMIKVFSNFF